MCKQHPKRVNLSQNFVDGKWKEVSGFHNIKCQMKCLTTLLSYKTWFKKMLRNVKVVETRRDFSPNQSRVPKGHGSARLPLKNSRTVRPQAGLKAGQHSTWDNPGLSAPSWPWSWEGDRDCALSFQLSQPCDQLPHFLSLRQTSLPKTTGKSRLWWQNDNRQTLSSSSAQLLLQGEYFLGEGGYDHLKC